MGIEPYTIQDLIHYYDITIGKIDGLKFENIYLVDDLEIIADKYNIDESTENISGFTVALDEIVIAVRNNLNGFNLMMALFHELTHAHDFCEFSQKYKVNLKDLPNHHLYKALQMYSEINAYYLGYKLTTEFLSQRNPLMKQLCRASMNPIDVQLGVLGKKKILIDDVFQCTGYLLLDGYFDNNDDYLGYLPDFVSQQLRNLIDLILDCYFDYNIEEISSIISRLCH